METSPGAKLSTPRRRLILLAGGGAMIAMLVAGGRISSSSLIAWASIILSVLLAGQVTSLVGRLQAGPSQAGLVPGAVERLDLLGTMIVPAVLVLGGIGLFGWIRPLPSAPSGAGGRNAFVLRALVAPATALALMAASILAFRLLGGPEAVGAMPWPASVAAIFGFVNLWLLVISLLPVPPLAGSVILERLLPLGAWARYARIRPYILPAALGVALGSFLLNLGLSSAAYSLLSGWWTSLLGA